MTEGGFSDHFPDAAAGYRAYRPTYPDELFAYLAGIVPSRERAWDCATGNGQAALKLAPHFREVIATDGSEKQIAQAEQAENIDYRIATAEHSGLDDTSIDLITVAQALHWFDYDAFSKEVHRVLKPKGILTAWTYNLLTCDPGVDACVNHFYDKIVGPYWPFERRDVETGYRDIQFPFDTLDAPPFAMTASWTLVHLIGYLATWSAVAAYEKDKGTNPIAGITEELHELWGDPSKAKAVEWPLSVRIWRSS
ncbi:MAG: class I SAM-dependent methyltransferase [Candidatus Hydrogenedentota bacterium]